VLSVGNRLEVRGFEGYPLRLRTRGEKSAFLLDGGRTNDIFYRIEAERGYDARGPIWSPGYIRVDLAPQTEMTLIASTEDWEFIEALSPGDAFSAEVRRRHKLLESTSPDLQDSVAAELVLAADQFLITPRSRRSDSIRATSSGEEAVTVIAGYPWFSDWGRDTMISLEGLTLRTGRHWEAAAILKTFSQYIQGGLIPNQFPEGRKEAVYNTADASLWYFAAVDAYLRVTGDRSILRSLLDPLRQILEAHLRGTRFGIGVDPADGLLRQGEEGFALTWMDALLGDWVVTPRRGKAVEINALWYNALRLMQEWVREDGGESAASPLRDRADQVYESFNRRFWNDSEHQLFDVVDGPSGDDPSGRPNQIFSISLPHAVLDPSRWTAVLNRIQATLLTPVGLRTLPPGHSKYQSKYDGDLRVRDGAYHQGTVWPWLIGAFVDAWLRCHPGEREKARQLLIGFIPHLSEGAVGSISEILDADPPFKHRGCVAQAWSVAELLRSWFNTAPT